MNPRVIYYFSNNKTMSNKVYILLSGLLVSATMIGLFALTSKLQEEKVTRVKTAASIPTPPKQAQPKNSQQLTLDKDKALTILNIWYQLDPEDDAGGVRLDNRIENANKVGIRTEMLSAIQSGYNIELPTLDGNQYLLKLGKVKKTTDTDMEIFGEIRGPEMTYYSSISVKDNTLLAVLSTPRGDYDLKMKDGKGYVYKSVDIDAHMPNATDSVIDLKGFLE